MQKMGGIVVGDDLRFAAMLDSLAAILVILTLIGFGIFGFYLAYKEKRRRNRNG